MPFPDDRESQPVSKSLGTQEQIIQYMVNVAVEARVKVLKAEFQQELEKQIKALEEKTKAGFPEGDLPGHRQAHEEMIEVAKERKAWIKDLRAKAVTGIGWIALLMVVNAVWEYIKRKARE